MCFLNMKVIGSTIHLVAMDTMEKYVDFSEDPLYTQEMMQDEFAKVKVPFMGYSVGDVVMVEIDFVKGLVWVDGKAVNFVISD